MQDPPHSAAHRWPASTSQHPQGPQKGVWNQRWDCGQCGCSYEERKNNHGEHWCLLVHLPLQTLSSQKGMQLSLSATKSAKSLSFLCKTGSMFNRFSSVTCQVFTKLYLFQILTKFQIFTKYTCQIFTYWFNWYLPNCAYLISSWWRQISSPIRSPKISHQPVGSLGPRRKLEGMKHDVCRVIPNSAMISLIFLNETILEFHYWYPILISYDLPAKYPANYSNIIMTYSIIYHNIIFPCFPMISHCYPIILSPL